MERNGALVIIQEENSKNTECLDRTNAGRFFKEDTDNELPFLLDEYLTDPGKKLSDLRSKMRLCNKKKSMDPLEDCYGSRVLKATTWDWINANEKSLKREYEKTSQYVIVELVRIKVYRCHLVTKTKAGLFRERMRQIITKYTDPVRKDGRDVFDWKFWDQIVLSEKDATKLKGITSLSTTEGLEENRRKNAHLQQLMKFMKSLQTHEICTIDGVHGGKVESNVSLGLKHVATVSHSNYYLTNTKSSI